MYFSGYLDIIFVKDIFLEVNINKLCNANSAFEFLQTQVACWNYSLYFAWMIHSNMNWQRIELVGDIIPNVRLLLLVEPTIDKE